eukprot:CAMPEP_0168623744 /NCGR_PEP_ID=MMETSP0449_2-20121227/8995_1 /TAXON_ID=1082188 /ORGANISM="Strombidium rassoulzadegani, Strain ras09" /LENGTH=228 /DNA_ID=CAMNT_0008665159 /DNA_START=268 /DNA_END=951 /DNA_ORIENTATION=-
MGELLRRGKVSLDVNKDQRYTIYPNFFNLSQVSHFGQSLSIPFSKQVILKEFFRIVSKNVELDKKKPGTLDALATKSLKEYKTTLKSCQEDLDRVAAYMDSLKGELSKTEEEYEAMQLKAQRRAKNKILLAFSVCFGQLSGMGYSIFIYSSWDVVEPLTWMVQSFWLMVGSTFFLAKRTDFDFEIAFEAFVDQEFQKLLKKSKFDLQKKETLEGLISELEEYHFCLRS